jgi:hypothetical protein
MIDLNKLVNDNESDIVAQDLAIAEEFAGICGRYRSFEDLLSEDCVRFDDGHMV